MTDLKLLAKAYYIIRATNSMIAAIIDNENPNVDPHWALDEITLKMKEIAVALKEKEKGR